MSVVAKRYYDRGIKAMQRGDYERALESLSSAVDLVPSFASARCAYGAALCKGGSPARAVQVLRAGLARKCTATSEAAMWACLGDALVATSQFAESADAYQQAKHHPEYTRRAAAGLALVRAKTGNYKRAFEFLSQASLDQ